jgi:hypothetical protein
MHANMQWFDNFLCGKDINLVLDHDGGGLMI